MQNAVPREQLGTATAAGVMFRQVGGSLAVAVFGALFAARMAAALGPDAETLTGGGGDRPGDDGGASPRRRANRSGRRSSPRFTRSIGAWQAWALIGLTFAFTLLEIPLRNRQVPKGE